MNKIYRTLIILLIVSNLNFAQVLLTHEKINYEKYSLTFKNEIPFKIIKKKYYNIIKFNNFDNLSNSGQFVLPRKDIYISIPPNTKPSVKLIDIQKKVIKAVPEIGQTAKLFNDSTIVYVKSKPANQLLSGRSYKIKGYLWIGDNYSIHLQVSLFYFDENSISVIQRKEFKIELNFKENIQSFESNKNINRNNIIVNKKYLFNNENSVKKYPENNNDSWIDYSKVYLKIGAGNDAIYRIDKNDLLNYDIPVNSIDPRTFRLYLKGKEIPIFVKGESDGVFNDNDFIEFVGTKNYGDKDYRDIAQYGHPYKEYMNRYTDTTIYWLTWGGNLGKRVAASLNIQGNPSDTISYYDKFIHEEKNIWYDFSLAGGEVRRQDPAIFENETWDWWVQGVGTKSFPFNVENLVKGMKARAYLKMQDWASNLFNKAHDLSLKINSDPAAYDSGYINKYEVKVLKAEFPSEKLKNGTNYLKFISYKTAANPNSCFGDWWEIVYPRKLILTDDSLLFGYRQLKKPVFANIHLANVLTNNFSLYKINNEYNSIKITDYNKIGDDVFFKDTVKQGTKYIFTGVNKIIKPKFYYKKRFVNLRNNANQADYLLITHPLFLNEAKNYAAFIRNNYGITVKVIDVFDIYDEFNFGFLSPEPIKDFLMMTQDNWQKHAPKYVFLVGKPTYDFKGYKTKYFGAPKQINYVPSYGHPVSDTWFVIWDTTGAAIPQMDIGRIPVVSVKEFQHYFQKHKNYLLQKYDDWNKRYLFMSGGNFNDANQLAQLKNVNDYIIDNYVTPPPIGGLSTHFYKTINPITNFGPYTQNEIKNAIAEGGLFISYIGHSGTQTWDNGISNAVQLENNINKNPLITDFGCSTGKFAEPDVTSFSEEFVDKPNGQAIAYVANSSLGFLTTAVTFPQIFYHKILKDSMLNIGDAHRLAKDELLNSYGSNGVFRLFSFTNSLIGDPIINLKIPTKPNLIIKNNSLKITPRVPNDILDSAKIKFVYFNYGTVTNDSFKIKFEDNYNNHNIMDVTLKKTIPLFKDSVIFNIPVKNKPGIHKLKLVLDPDNEIDEIYENDNTFTGEVNVLSGSIKMLLDYTIENEVNDTLLFLNPALNSGTKFFKIQLSSSKDFLNSKEIDIPFDTLKSKYILPDSYKNKRFWIRTKLPSSDNYGGTRSFYDGNKNAYLINDSISFGQSVLDNQRIVNNSVRLDSLRTKFSVISAGFNDGNTSLILKNSQNFIPENTLRGHHICVFDDSTYKFIQYKHFDLLGGGAAEANKYFNFLDTLSSKYLVLFAVSDEGAVGLSSKLKNEIKKFGSKYIDSLVFRGSWAFIGKKGAARGSMPEAFSKPYNGRVQIDTVITKLNKNGKLLTSVIGPASEWEKLKISESQYSGSKIKYRILGIKNNSSVDTLNYLTLNNGLADLSFLNKLDYNFIKIISEFKASKNLISPVLKSLEVQYTGVPELGINYQKVKIKKDTLQQGDNAGLSFNVYNIGESDADSFDVRVDIVNPNNFKKTVFLQPVNSLKKDNHKMFNVIYNTTPESGNLQFDIAIDPQKEIIELYKNNNYYTVPFFVVKDTTKPSLDITFNGSDIFDDDYVSSNPDIKIKLSDPSPIPITDTSAVKLLLNGKPVFYAENQQKISITYSQSNPKVVVIIALN